MAFNSRITPTSYSWGDVIKVKNDSPKKYKPGSRGIICGIRTVENKVTVDKFGVEMGSILYLIEFGNGEALEIPASLVEIL